MFLQVIIQAFPWFTSCFKAILNEIVLYALLRISAALIGINAS